MTKNSNQNQNMGKVIAGVVLGAVGVALMHEPTRKKVKNYVKSSIDKGDSKLDEFDSKVSKKAKEAKKKMESVKEKSKGVLSEKLGTAKKKLDQS